MEHDAAIDVVSWLRATLTRVDTERKALHRERFFSRLHLVGRLAD